MTDRYAWWKNALAGSLGLMHEGQAECGFFRKRGFNSGPWQRVAIWPTGDELTCTVDGKIADAASIWTFVCRNPVTEAEFRKIETGGDWSDEPPTPKLSNLPSDPCEALAIEFAAEREIAAEFLAKPVTTKDQADQVAVLTKRLSTIKGKATDLHKVEKLPSLDEGRRVDDKWRALKEEPDELGKKLKRHLDPYLQELDRQEIERQRLSREEAARIRREAEADALKAQAVEDTLDREKAKEAAAKTLQAARDAEHEAEARNPAAGRTGAKVALRTYMVAEITDFDALLMALKGKPEIVEAVNALANRAARAGVALPGMSIKEERRAA